MTGSVVLIGAGHAHMELVRQARRFAHAGLKLTLIDPGAFWYSGAATGVLSGALETGASRFDPAGLEGPVTHIRQRVVRVDPDQRQVILDTGRSLAFDVVSLNTGSHVSAPDLIAAGAIPAKPVEGLMALKARLQAAEGRLRLAVAGAGATGIELALNLAGLQRRLGARVNVILAGPDLLPDWPETARALAHQAIKRAGVSYIPAQVRRYESGMIRFEGQKLAPVEAVIAATGLEARLPEGVPHSAAGLPVGETLSWLENDRIFAVGDCACLTTAPRPKLGVFGVRAAPVLLENLIRAATGRTPRRRYTPQNRWLSIMDMGDGAGLGRYGGFAFQGRWVLHLKRRLDHRFMNRFKTG